MATHDLPKWSCTIETPPRDNKGYTVGEVFTLSCEGPSVPLQEPLKILAPPQSPQAGNAKTGAKEASKESEVSADAPFYTLMLLKPQELKETGFKYQATSYTPGEFALKELIVVDNKNQPVLQIPQLQYRVQSVLDPQNPAKEPFGPVGPLSLAWPTWIFFAVLVVGLVLLAWAAVFLRRWLQRRSLEKNIKKFLSPMGSYHQFHKDLRLLKKGLVFSSHEAWPQEQIQQYLQALREALLMFLLREFIVPAKQWTTTLLVKGIAKKDKKYFSRYSKNLSKSLQELDRSLAETQKVSARDCEQITILCVQAVESIWDSQRKKQNSKEQISKGLSGKERERKDGASIDKSAGARS